jgi:hypothetical protein
MLKQREPADRGPFSKAANLGFKPTLARFTLLALMSSVPHFFALQEDDALRRRVEELEARKRINPGVNWTWVTVAKAIHFRDHKSCWQRWSQHLKPGLVEGPITPAEDKAILEAIIEKGTRFSGVQLLSLFQFFLHSCFILAPPQSSAAALLASASCQNLNPRPVLSLTPSPHFLLYCCRNCQTHSWTHGQRD